MLCRLALDMPIAIVCERCGERIEAPDVARGKIGECPNCGFRSLIPRTDVVKLQRRPQTATGDSNDPTPDEPSRSPAVVPPSIAVRHHRRRRRPSPYAGLMTAMAVLSLVGATVAIVIIASRSFKPTRPSEAAANRATPPDASLALAGEKQRRRAPTVQILQHVAVAYAAEVGDERHALGKVAIGEASELRIAVAAAAEPADRDFWLAFGDERRVDIGSDPPAWVTFRLTGDASDAVLEVQPRVEIEGSTYTLAGSSLNPISQQTQVALVEADNFLDRANQRRQDIAAWRRSAADAPSDRLSRARREQRALDLMIQELTAEAETASETQERIERTDDVIRRLQSTSLAQVIAAR